MHIMQHTTKCVHEKKSNLAQQSHKLIVISALYEGQTEG